MQLSIYETIAKLEREADDAEKKVKAYVQMLLTRLCDAESIFLFAGRSDYDRDLFFAMIRAYSDKYNSKKVRSAILEKEVRYATDSQS